MKTSKFKQITSIPFFNYSFSILLLLLFCNFNTKGQEHCLVIKNISVNPAGSEIAPPNCDGSLTIGCQPSEFIELFNTCNTSQNFGCYMVCNGNWCVRIPSSIPDLPPGGTIVLGSTFSPGFDAANPFHIDIHNCNNCAWVNTADGNPFNDLGILSNSNGQAVLYNPVGDIEMGLYWGGGRGPFGSLEIMFDDACPTQNLIINFPDPNSNPRFIDLGDLAETDNCTISIPCVVIDDDEVSANAPEALCAYTGQDVDIGGSTPFASIEFNHGDDCFFVGDEKPFLVIYEPKIPAATSIDWSSASPGVLFDSQIGTPQATATGPSAEIIFTAAGTQSVTVAVQSAIDCYTYYYTEEFVVSESIDLSGLQVCVGGPEFTIDEAIDGLTGGIVVLSNELGFIINALPFPATFTIPANQNPGTYFIRFQDYCIVDVPLEVLPADQCQTGCGNPCFAEYGTDNECITPVIVDPPNIPLPEAICGNSELFYIMNQQPSFVWYSDMDTINRVYTGNDFNPFLYTIIYAGTSETFWVVNVNADGCRSEATEVIFRIWDSTTFGCTDMDACNFDMNAICDDGSCFTVPMPLAETIELCTVIDVFYSPISGDLAIPLPNPTFNWYEDESADFFITNSNPFSPEVQAGLNPMPGTAYSFWVTEEQNGCESLPTEIIFSYYLTGAPECIPGCIDITACNYNPVAQIEDNSLCNYEYTTCNTDPCLGDIQMPDPANPCGPCILVEEQVIGCAEADQCGYNPDANCNDQSMCLGSNSNPGICNNDCTAGPIEWWNSVDCICEDDPLLIEGCIDPCAINYVPYANVCGNCEYPVCDDGNCINGVETWDTATCSCVSNSPEGTLGCTNPLAPNYDPNAICDDGSCNIAVCTNEAGLMQSSSSMVCSENSIFVREAFSVANELSTKAYVMHQSKAFDGQNYITIQNNGRFVSPGVEYHNQPVYISAIVGPPGTDGLPNLADPCTVWTPYGAYIVFFDPVTISVVDETCLEDQYYVDVRVTGGVGGTSLNRAYRTVTDGTTTYQSAHANEVLSFGPYKDVYNFTIEALGVKGCTGSLTQNIACGGIFRMLDYSLNADIIKVVYANTNQQIQSIEVYNLNAQQIPIELSIDGHQSEVRLLTVEKGLCIIKVLTINNEIDYIKVLR